MTILLCILSGFHIEGLRLVGSIIKIKSANYVESFPLDRAYSALLSYPIWLPSIARDTVIGHEREQRA